MKINHLTSAEENLMKLFWKLDTFYLKDIMEQHPEPKPHQNTVSTYLKILVEKGYLSTEKEGRIFKYKTALPLEEYKKFILSELAAHFFNGSGKEIVDFLLSEDFLTEEDLQNSYNLKIELNTTKKKEPELEYAEEVLKIKKSKKGKEKKKKKKEQNKA
ncbi:BlaI/MecI/CopY family transcriptional regulator [Chryseobacterium sp. RR2-3-20]|uniref:BlaI/MecI/CopY family transcriptional regulator n=1 Tax=Chryseobacterium sp. RR2-3-20 TaxID=2787626 RepID=UPI001AE07DA8|nr:BlaI/MecI/CopY family transcriptional regulator [Chryseobacterium sp. RR2-3-20]